MRSLELRVPPLVVVLVAAGLMWLLARTFPGYALRVPAAMALAVVLFLAGAAFTLSGVLAFRRANTTVNPTTPEASATVVSTGVYARTRNPMYLGMLLALLAWAVALDSLTALLGPIAFVLYMNRFQIAPEERALHEKFGAAYDAYCAGVGRWI